MHHRLVRELVQQRRERVEGAVEHEQQGRRRAARRLLDSREGARPIERVELLLQVQLSLRRSPAISCDLA